MGDLLATNAEVRNGCDRLTIDEIMTTIEELGALTHNASAQAVQEREQALVDLGDASLQSVVQHAYDVADQQYLSRLKQAGFDVPDPISLDPAPAPEPDDRFDEKFGIGFSRGVADPFLYHNED